MNSYKRKKKGSILIECVLAIMIIMSVTEFIVMINVKNYKIIQERILSENLNESVNNLIKEIKFNTSKNTIDEIFSSGTLNLKYNDSFSEELMEKPIEQLERNNESENSIKVHKVSESERGTEFSIIANAVKGNLKVQEEERFIKSWWMYEV